MPGASRLAARLPAPALSPPACPAGRNMHAGISMAVSDLPVCNAQFALQNGACLRWGHCAALRLAAAPSVQPQLQQHNHKQR